MAHKCNQTLKVWDSNFRFAPKKLFHVCAKSMKKGAAFWPLPFITSYIRYYYLCCNKIDSGIVLKICIIRNKYNRTFRKHIIN